MTERSFKCLDFRTINVIKMKWIVKDQRRIESRGASTMIGRRRLVLMYSTTNCTGHFLKEKIGTHRQVTGKGSYDKTGKGVIVPGVRWTGFSVSQGMEHPTLSLVEPYIVIVIICLLSFIVARSSFHPAGCSSLLTPPLVYSSRVSR